MNRERLQKVFQNYIRKFEMINNRENDENFKWEAASVFRELMDPESDHFADNIKEAVKRTSVLVDGKQRYCFSSLAKCAEAHEEQVRSLFRALFADDGGDLVVRQGKIQTFVRNANQLISQTYTSNGMYMNDQRSAMAYLFLYDPENNYLYKASEAKDFAACIEFYGDWGSGADFHLDVYYRMCDCLVEEIRRNQALLDKHNERYASNDGGRTLHPDQNYHILAFDIIYGAPKNRYDFYEDVKFEPITAEDYKNAEKALALHKEWESAQQRVSQLDAAEAYFNRVFCIGKNVRDKFDNEGIITKIDRYCVYVQFPQQEKPKAYLHIKSYLDKTLTTDDPELEEMIEKYREVLKIGEILRKNLQKAEAALAPFRAYLTQ